MKIFGCTIEVHSQRRVLEDKIDILEDCVNELKYRNQMKNKEINILEGSCEHLSKSLIKEEEFVSRERTYAREVMATRLLKLEMDDKFIMEVTNLKEDELKEVKIRYGFERDTDNV